MVIHHGRRLVLGLTGISAVIFLLVIVYCILVQSNRSAQAEVNQRQQFINQSVELRRINEVLIRAIAAAAVSKKDDKLRALLTENGIVINDTLPQPASTPAAKGQ